MPTVQRRPGRRQTAAKAAAPAPAPKKTYAPIYKQTTKALAAMPAPAKPKPARSQAVRRGRRI